MLGDRAIVTGGCELWLHRRFSIKASHIFVLHTASDCLVVRTRLLGEPFLFVVLHAPQSGVR